MNDHKINVADSPSDVPSVIAVLREGITALRDRSFVVSADGEEYFRRLSDLLEEIELDGSIPKLDLLEREVLNEVLRRFRFYQDRAGARVAVTKARTTERDLWCLALSHCTRQIEVLEQLIGFRQ